MAEKYEITGIPTFICVQNDQVVDTLVGTESFESWMKKVCN